MNDYDSLPDDIKKILDESSPLDEILPTLKEKADKLISSPKYYAEYLKAEFADEINNAMEKLGLNKNTLAEKMGCSRQYVGRVLNENANFTIETMAAFALALNMKLDIEMYEKDALPEAAENKVLQFLQQ